MRNVTAAVALVMLLTACSTSATRRTPQLSTSRILTGAELQHPIARNAFDLIRMVRPQFFQFSRSTQHAERVVYIDGLRADRAEDLRLVPTDVISEIRLMSAGEASFRFGRDHPAGVIVVTTKVRPPGGRRSAVPIRP